MQYYRNGRMSPCFFFTFLPILSIHKDTKISSQPTVKGHSVFTDYMFHLTREYDTHTNKPLLIIEVKREETSCQISETPAFAQMLREVHIIGQHLPLDTLLPFILTK